MLKNMTIGTKLGVGFTSVVFLIIVTTCACLISLNNMDAALDRIVNVNNYRTDLAGDARNNVSIIAMMLRDMLLEKDRTKRQDALRRLQVAR